MADESIQQEDRTEKIIAGLEELRNILIEQRRDYSTGEKGDGPAEQASFIQDIQAKIKAVNEAIADEKKSKDSDFNVRSL